MCLRPSIVKVAFSEISLSKVTLAFDPQNILAQEVINKDPSEMIMYFILKENMPCPCGGWRVWDRHIKNVGQNFYLLFEVFAIPVQPNKE